MVRIMLYLCERAVLLMWSWYAHQRHMVIAQACDAASGSTCRGSVSDGGERQRAQARAHLLHGEPCHTHHLSQSMLSSPHHLRIARNLFWMQREDLLRRTPSDGQRCLCSTGWEIRNRSNKFKVAVRITLKKVRAVSDSDSCVVRGGLCRCRLSLRKQFIRIVSHIRIRHELSTGNPRSEMDLQCLGETTGLAKW